MSESWCSYIDFVITLADFEKGVFYFKTLFILFVQENINSGTDFLAAAPQWKWPEGIMQEVLTQNKETDTGCVHEGGKERTLPGRAGWEYLSQQTKL